MTNVESAKRANDVNKNKGDCMRRCFITTAFALLTAFWVSGETKEGPDNESASDALAENGETKTIQDSRDALFEKNRGVIRGTIAYLNQLTYAYQVMKSYQNVVAVQDEYDKISFDRLESTGIPKEEGIFDLILAMQNKLKEVAMGEEELRYYRKVNEDSRRRAKKEMWTKILLSVPQALGDAKDVIVKQSAKGGDTYTVGAEAAVALAGDLISGPVSAYVNYNKTLEQLRANEEKLAFDFKRSKQDVVHTANQKLLTAAYKLTDKYQLQRGDVCNPEEFRDLVNVLKKGSVDGRFRLLNNRNMRNHYARFAPFWQYLASFALQSKKYDVVIEACEKFFEVYCSIIKNDPMVAQVSMAEIVALMKQNSKDHAKIRRLLQRIGDVNYDNKYADYSYFCADVMYHYLGDDKAAIEAILDSIAYLEGEFSERLFAYRDKYTKPDAEVAFEEVPSEVDLIRARTLYSDILEHRHSPSLKSELEKICEGATTASLEKLYYLGRVRLDDLWMKAKPDILAIRLSYVRMPLYKMCKNRFVVEIPISWFYLGDVIVRLELCKDGKIVETLSSSEDENAIKLSPDGIGGDVVTKVFVCKASMLKGIDSVRLVFPHESIKFEADYRPSIDFDVQTGKDRNDDTSYIPCSVRFMEKEYDVVTPDPQLRSKILERKLPNHTAIVMPYVVGSKKCQTNFIESVSFAQDRSVLVAYTNITPLASHISFDVTYFSAYGASLGHVEANYPFKAHEGGVWQMDCPDNMKSMEKPTHVLLQYHVEQSVWDWAQNKWAKQSADEKGPGKDAGNANFVRETNGGGR